MPGVVSCIYNRSDPFICVDSIFGDKSMCLLEYDLKNKENMVVQMIAGIRMR